MLFELTEEEKLIQAAAARFAKQELEPVAAELDRTKDRDILLTNLKNLAALGFMGINIRSEYGGTDSNFGIREHLQDRRSHHMRC